jgi:chromosome segregation ATPase
METIQAYQEQSQQAVDAKVINSGVAKEREDRILKKAGHQQSNMDGIVMDMYQQKAELERLTYMDEGVAKQLYMRACYRLKVKEPLKELDRKRQEILADVQVLELEQDRYNAQIENLDEKIKDANGWVFDSDKTLREREEKKEALLEELSYEQQEVENCREAYKTAASKEEKGNLLEMVRGYEASRSEKEAQIRQLDDEISKASQSFNEFYDEQEMLKESKNNFLDVKQSVNDMQNDLVFLARQFNNIVQDGGFGPLATAELLAALQHKMGGYVNMAKRLKEITEGQYAAIGKMAETGKPIKEEFAKSRKNRNNKVNRKTEDEVQRAKERRESLYRI